MHCLARMQRFQKERRFERQGACRCGAEAAAELQRLADSSFGSKASQAGAPVLRLLQTLTAVCKPDATQVGDGDVPADQPRPASTCLATARRLAEQRALRVQGLSAKQKAALDSCASRLEGLWSILSQCIARIEDSLDQQTPQQEQAHLLPPEAAQVSATAALAQWPDVLCGPYVANVRAGSAFRGGLLCAVRCQDRPPPAAGARDAPGSFVGTGQVHGLDACRFGDSARLAQLGRLRPAGSPPTGGPGRAPALPTVLHSRRLANRRWVSISVSHQDSSPRRFAEKHRKLLNALLRQHPNLLEGSLSPLLRVARLVDFDNKRSYFRTKVRSHGPEHRRTTLRINVRREHVFEDSFHQLRIRCVTPPSCRRAGRGQQSQAAGDAIDAGKLRRTPEEMRAKLSVHFQGEEGIDAGGVSREWYQVGSRSGCAGVSHPLAPGAFPVASGAGQTPDALLCR